MVLAIANVEKPVIAAVRDPVARIGWSLALACDPRGGIGHRKVHPGVPQCRSRD
jgi:hypothetical protein